MPSPKKMLAQQQNLAVQLADAKMRLDAQFPNGVMLSEIEQFILGGDFAHELNAIALAGDILTIDVRRLNDLEIPKKFSFTNVRALRYECLLAGDETLEFMLPVIAFESKRHLDGQWEFCLNAADAEWIFTADWPTRIE